MRGWIETAETWAAGDGSILGGEGAAGLLVEFGLETAAGGTALGDGLPNGCWCLVM